MLAPTVIRNALPTLFFKDLRNKLESLRLTFNVCVVKTQNLIKQISVSKSNSQRQPALEPEVAKRMRILQMHACTCMYQLTNRIRITLAISR